MIKVVLSFFVLASFFPGQALAATSLSTRLSGRILLQVESKGEAWYVNTGDTKRYSLGRPSDAFELMRGLGIGITNLDLAKIPVALMSSSAVDSDHDGLSDDIEVSLGTDLNKSDTDGDGHDDKTEVLGAYNPKGPGKVALDNSFISRNKGKIFLQVQGKGEAWYVDPVSLKRYFLGRPADAFALMRHLGLGISNSDLSLISIAYLPTASSGGQTSSEASLMEDVPLDLSVIEQRIHVLINEERAAAGLPALKWNEEVAAVAREHSQDLAEENQLLTDLNRICNYAVIHHEGKEFGLMPADRLNSRDVNYYSKAGENIALIGAAEVNYLVNSLTFNEADYSACQSQVEEWNNDLKKDMESLSSESAKLSRLNQELSLRRSALLNSQTFQISRIEWRSNELSAQESVIGWMNSPGHKANILDSEYDEAGIGVTYVNGYIVATQVFIKRAVCGYENGPCCQGYACYLPTVCAADNICR
jgi:uncharacterized protein YkwD